MLLSSTTGCSRGYSGIVQRLPEKCQIRNLTGNSFCRLHVLRYFLVLWVGCPRTPASQLQGLQHLVTEGRNEDHVELARREYVTRGRTSYQLGGRQKDNATCVFFFSHSQPVCSIALTVGITFSCGDPRVLSAQVFEVGPPGMRSPVESTLCDGTRLLLVTARASVVHLHSALLTPVPRVFYVQCESSTTGLFVREAFVTEIGEIRVGQRC